MIARIRENLHRDGHDLVLIEGDRQDRHVLVPDAGQPDGWARIKITEEAAQLDTKPPMFLPRGALEAILDAGAEHVSPQLRDERQARLDDALGQRDQLLQLLLAQGYDRIHSVAAITTAQGGTP